MLEELHIPNPWVGSSGFTFQFIQTHFLREVWYMVELLKRSAPENKRSTPMVRNSVHIFVWVLLIRSGTLFIKRPTNPIINNQINQLSTRNRGNVVIFQQIAFFLHI